uniref:Uncharacterized protein n=1 Tax=Knipowitschia caucasica TaxID=637954 RepID=A0AAV2LGD4_KNICA
MLTDNDEDVSLFDAEEDSGKRSLKGGGVNYSALGPPRGCLPPHPFTAAALDLLPRCPSRKGQIGAFRPPTLER